MIVIYGKGKVGKAVSGLLSFLSIPFSIMDDADRDEHVLKNAQQIVVSPGIPQHHILYEQFRNKIIGELDLIAQLSKDHSFPDIETIGITGTNGKSTTSWIAYSVFKKLFEQQGSTTPVYISGNFGTPLSEVIVDVLQQGISKAFVVLELSSFMLYTTKNFEFTYGILTNIATDHLDWHKDFDEYVQCKLQLLQQTQNTTLLTQETCDQINTISSLSKKEVSKNKITIFDDDFDLSPTQFIGKHNQYNFKSVDMLVRQYYSDHDLQFPTIQYQQIVSEVTPLDHRMKLAKVIKYKNQEIQIYDDGICSSAHALKGALQGFKDQKIVLIAGGYDKGEEYTHLKKILRERVVFASLIGTTGKEKFIPLSKQMGIAYAYSKTLKEAIDKALQYAKENTISVVLFSPGSASFDMFKNVYDRCEQFDTIIKDL